MSQNFNIQIRPAISPKRPVLYFQIKFFVFWSIEIHFTNSYGIITIQFSFILSKSIESTEYFFKFKILTEICWPMSCKLWASHLSKRVKNGQNNVYMSNKKATKLFSFAIEDFVLVALFHSTRIDTYNRSDRHMLLSLW